VGNRRIRISEEDRNIGREYHHRSVTEHQRSVTDMWPCHGGLPCIWRWRPLAYLDWGLQLEEDWLRDKDLTSLGAEETDLSLQELNLLSRSATSDFQQSIYDGVEVDFILVRHFYRPLAGERRLVVVVSFLNRMSADYFRSMWIRPLLKGA
jgi:hypothetical protein